MVYFDNAATTYHKPQSVINAVNYALNNLSANPGRSGHLLAINVDQMVYDARQKVSNFFGSGGAQTVVFTQNCTQSINYVLKGVLEKNDHIIISDLEHNAVIRPITSMGLDYSVATISLEDDNITIENFKSQIKSNTKMIFCTSASNVIGKILPLKMIGDLCKEKGILFGVDAAQGAGIIPIDMNKMNIDYLCVAAHKGLYCPMGLGILIARNKINKTIIEGGTGTNSLDLIQPNTLPEMLESGTINVPAIATLKYGINFVEKRKNYLLNYENNLVKRLYKNLQNEEIVFYSNPLIYDCVPVLSFNVKGLSSDDVSNYLNKNGFALRAGFHCAPMAHKKIGTINQGAIRFSPSIFNSVTEVDMLINKLKKIKK